MPAWTFAVTNRAGTVAALPEPSGAQLTLRLNGAAELTGVQDARTSAATEFEPAATAVRAYRDGVLRFNGLTSEPLVRGARGVQFRAADPWEVLTQRFRASARTFTTTDAATILKELVDDENAREATLLDVATPPVTVNRDRAYEPGKQIAEAGLELANADDGFWFYVTPLDTGAAGETDVGQLQIKYPAAGTDRDAAVFYYVPTGANLADWTEEFRNPKTSVTALGAREGETQTTGTASDAAGIAAYGLLELQTSHTDVSEQALLDDLAAEALEPVPPAAYTVAPIAFHEDGPRVPTLFDDFVPGDRVRLRILHGATDVDEWALVTAATLAIDDRGTTERLTNLVLEIG